MKGLKYIFVAIVLLSISGCSNRHKDPSAVSVSVDSLTVFADNDELGYIGQITANDYVIITSDVHDGYAFNCHPIDTANKIIRFGRIGSGPNELQQGTHGEITGNRFHIYNSMNCKLQYFELDSLDNSNPQFIQTCRWNNAMIDEVLPANDSIFIAMGIYNNKYHHFAFNNSGQIIDSLNVVFNSDSDLNIFHLILSNQGKMTRHPDKPLFASAVIYSEIIEFISYVDGHLHSISNINRRNPELIAESADGMFSMSPTLESKLGYIDIASNADYVFVLNADHTFAQGGFGTNNMLIFDWTGKQLMSVQLPDKAAALSVNSTMLYFITENDGEERVIKCLPLDSLFHKIA